MNKPLAPLALALALASLGGCEVGPNYHRPDQPMPRAFAVDIPQTQPSATAPAPRPVDLTRWWTALGDPELNLLVRRAVSANLDIEIAFTRLQEARTMERVDWGQALPSGDFSGAAARGSGNNSVRGRVDPTLHAGDNTTGLKEITEEFGFNAAWEPDLFGKYRRSIEAAGADTQAAVELRRAVLLSVIADVARSYLDVRGLQLRLAIVQSSINTEQQSVDFVQARFSRGLINELDLALARRELATVQATVAPLQADLAAAKRRIAVLLGLFPEELDSELAQAHMLPTLAPAIQTGLPVDLLRRRPDIAQAERQAGAETARIGVTIASMFPSVVISGALGMQGQGLGRVPAGESFIWSAGPGAYWPLLDFGTLDALTTVQDLRAHEALINYKRTILNAVEEVSNGITNYAAQQDRLARLGDALVASQRAVDLASQRYDRGLTDFLNVLDAQRQLYTLQDQYASSQEAVVLQFIGVYMGLGGGWEDFPAGPAPPRPRPAIVAAFARLIQPETFAHYSPAPNTQEIPRGAATQPAP